MITEGMVRTIAVALAKTGYNFCFIGGAASVFYISDENANRVRPTRDIDCVIEIYVYSEYVMFQESIKKLGFIPDKDSESVCRYLYKNIPVDIIPLKSKDIIGFENSWYEKGLECALSKEMGDIIVKYFPLHYYIASKLEALKHRGINDLMGSRDFEDIIIIFDGLDSFNIIEEFSNDVRQFMKDIFSNIIKQSNFADAVIGHIDISPIREQRAHRIIHFMQEFVND